MAVPFHHGNANVSTGGRTDVAKAGRVTTLPPHLIPLDDRQRAFVLTYPEDFQPGKAAERAGYGNGNPGLYLRGAPDV